MPLRVNPKLAYAPYLLLISIAVEVPTAWAAVPMERPWAIGLPTCISFIVLNPRIAPSNPTQTTTAAVSEGMPPNVLVTSMAIGVVTDLGANDRITSWDAPINLAINTTETTPIKQPASCDSKIGSNCFLIVSNWRYNGTPNATTAGFNQNSIRCPPLLYVS